MASNAAWAAMSKQSLAKAAQVQPPAPPSAAVLAKAAADNARLKKHMMNLVPAIKKAPIYIASTHGAYNLKKDPVAWTVPPNTFIFETQTIGDTTLTKIDNLLWKLCLPKYRPAFFHYFMGNAWFFERKGGRPLELYMELFRNLILYKPGDSIYERELSIGGGHAKEADGSAREKYVNMGFYKFRLDSPEQAPPKRTTARPMAPIELPELNPLRTALIEDDDFSFTNKQFVELINKNTGISYPGKAGLTSPTTFTYKNDGETVRIIIFSSCAAVNCNPPRPVNPWPPQGYSEAETKKMVADYAKAVKAAYASKECNGRMALVERQQHNMQLELMQMGINTGQGGSGWALNYETMKTLGLASRDLRPTKGKSPSLFLPEAYQEHFAEIDSDISEWWALVGIDAGVMPEQFNATRHEGGFRRGSRSRKLGRRRKLKSRKNRS